MSPEVEGLNPGDRRGPRRRSGPARRLSVGPLVRLGALARGRAALPPENDGRSGQRGDGAPRLDPAKAVPRPHCRQYADRNGGRRGAGHVHRPGHFAGSPCERRRRDAQGRFAGSGRRARRQSPSLGRERERIRVAWAHARIQARPMEMLKRLWCAAGRADPRSPQRAFGVGQRAVVCGAGPSKRGRPSSGSGCHTAAVSTRWWNDGRTPGSPSKAPRRTAT